MHFFTLNKSLLRQITPIMVIVVLAVTNFAGYAQITSSSSSNTPKTFVQPSSVSPSKGPAILKTVTTLVPCDEIGQYMQSSKDKYFVIPRKQYDEMQTAKQEYLLKSAEAPEMPSPVAYRVLSLNISGEIKGDFAHLQAEFSIESFTDEWQFLELLSGSIVIDSVFLDDMPTALNVNVDEKLSRSLQFENRARIPQSQAFYGRRNYQDFSRQNRWTDNTYVLPFRGSGIRKCVVNFLAPVEKIEDKLALSFSPKSVPLTFFRLSLSDYVMTVDTTSFQDYTVEADSSGPGCKFFGWLGAAKSLNISWRRRVRHFQTPKTSVGTSPEEVGKDESAGSDAEPEVAVKSPPRPLVFARSETMITLGENALQGYVAVEYTITKATVSNFALFIPEDIEIISVRADKPQTYRLIREEGRKLLNVDFVSAREGSCRIFIAFESRLNNAVSPITIPEVHPVGVERELGTLGIQALASVEIRPSAEMESRQDTRTVRIDPVELPESLKTSTARTILLAYRFSTRPADIELEVIRYQDRPQQTVVADSIDLKTAFTSNRTSNSCVSLKIRNNNKQYLTMQLASGSEVISAFRNNKPVKLVTGRGDGKVQIPLLMSKRIGQPEEMDIRIMYNDNINQLNWKGGLSFAAPLVDIPVSHYTWTVYAPEKIKLYNFSGSVKAMSAPREPFFFHGFLKLYDLTMVLLYNPATVLFFSGLILVLILLLAREWLAWFARSTLEFIWWLFRNIFASGSFTLIELGIIVAIVGIMAAVAVPNFRKARQQARHKACFANQRVIMGAIEMYNMDNDVQMKTEINFDALTRGKYIRGTIVSPESDCSYGIAGDITESGEVFCRLHGSVDNPNYDTSGFTKKYVSQSTLGKSPVSAPTEKGKIASEQSVARARGTIPIESRFVMTSNFYQFQRDLVLPETSSQGELGSNDTSPILHFNYISLSVLQIMSILAFILGLFSGLYFIAGSFYNLSMKIYMAGVIIFVLSILDRYFEIIGDYSLFGLWLALIAGALWKIIWNLILYFRTLDSGSPGNPPISPPGGGPRSGKQSGFFSGSDFDERIKISSLGDNDGNGHDEDLPEPSLRRDADSQPAGIPVIIALIMALLLIPAIAFCEEATREIKIVLPYSDITKFVSPGGDAVLIPESEYKYLQYLGSHEPKKEIEPPMKYMISSALYKGQVEEKGVRFTGSFRIDVMAEGWKSIFLLSREAVPSACRINGKSATLDHMMHGSESGFGLVLQATGTFDVEMDFFVPLQVGDLQIRRFELPVVKTCVSKAVLIIPEEKVDLWVDPGVVSSQESKDGKTVFEIAFPTTSRIAFEILPKVHARPSAVTAEESDGVAATASTVIKEETRVTVNSLNLVSIEEGFAAGRNKYELVVTGTDGIASFSFLVPTTVRILKVEGSGIEDWKVEEEKNRKLNRLNIFFASQMRGKVGLTINYEEDINVADESQYPIPELLPLGFHRVGGILGVACLSALEITTREISDGYSVIDPGELTGQWGETLPEKLPYAFKFFGHPNRLVVELSRPKDVEMVTAAIDKAEAMTLVSEDGYMITRIVYEVKNNSEQFLKVKLPQIGSTPLELWSSEVADQAVRAGYDEANGQFNIPIIRSPTINNEPQAFPVSMVFATRLESPLQPLTRLRIELPWVHLTVSELSWVVYLPDSFELMKPSGNVDLSQMTLKQPLLDGTKMFSGVNLSSSPDSKSKGTLSDSFSSGSGIVGLLPVRFNIPRTNWFSSFKMNDIRTNSPVPAIEAIIMSPGKGFGRLVFIVMMLIGSIAGISLTALLSGKKPLLSLTVLSVATVIVAITLILKLYQADHAFKMGFLSTFVMLMLFLLYRHDPTRSARLDSSVKS